MTSPIAPHRPDPWIPHEAPSATPATNSPVAVRELPELPDTNAAAVANAVQAAKAGTARPLVAMGINASVIQTSIRDTAIERRLDAFLQSATPTFHTPAEGDVKVGIPFRLPTAPSSSSYGIIEANVRDNSADLAVIAKRVGLEPRDVGLLNDGRATPEQVRRVTQGLIDAGRLPPPDGVLALAGRVRTMMCNYGIGLDCAGYTQQAFMASRGVRRSQTELVPPDRENLSGLSQKGFSRIDMADARPGDVIVLKPPPHEPFGHTAIVHDARYATADEWRALVAKHPDARDLNLSHLKRLEVDSSWGSGADPLIGGVDRRTWWHDESSDKWVTETKDGILVSHQPYWNHPLEGAYRPRTEP